MKISKNFIIIFILLISQNIFSIFTELLIRNNSNYLIRVDVYPVGMIFNGYYNYSFKKKRNISGFDFIVGSSSTQDIDPETEIGFEHDGQGNTEDDPPEALWSSPEKVDTKLRVV